jgi:hypothetical protein
MTNDRKHSQASTRRRIAAAATLSVVAGVLGLETGASAAPSNHAVHLLPVNRQYSHRKASVAPATTAGAVVPRTPAGLNAPTTVIFDDEFSGGSLNTTVWAPDWFVSGSTQNNTVMNSSNVSVGANGLNLKLNANGTGALVSSNPHGGAGTGFQAAPRVGRPVYVEYTATLPASGTQIANWPGLWLTGQTWPNTGEIDVMEGFGTSQFHIEYGPSSNQVSNPGGVGGTTAGTHTYGVLWTTTGVTFVYDSVVVGSESAALSGVPRDGELARLAKRARRHRDPA